METTATPNPKPNLRIDAFTSSLIDQVNISSITSTRQNGVSPEALAEKWDIGLTTEKRTTKVTIQQGVRTVEILVCNGTSALMIGNFDTVD